MAYTFKNTEINNEKASNFETKSLLYLIGKRSDSKEIEYVTFDCFNDVSGVNKQHDKIWDIQSKNEKALSPKKIGTYFFTLFDNYISAFAFKEFIFFSPALNLKYKINVNLNCYTINNIQTDTKARIRNGLVEEVKRVKGDLTDYSLEIDNFLKIVSIVEDSGTENEYIKLITKFKKTDIKSDEFYKSVFIDLRNIQSGKKNSYIENTIINEICDVLLLRRHLSVKEIELLIISRILGCEIFKFQGIPLYFSTCIHDLNIEDKRDTLEECNGNLSKAFFNKNANKAFWKICEDILTYFSSPPIAYDVEQAYKSIFHSYSVKISYLNEITIKYLISIIIEGLE
ncbi:MAG: hypothetical protein JWN56_1121 [Sphingobacteriales bacterium]|nr:hypothetical protein [Sphingobacteriales bacterium]